MKPHLVLATILVAGGCASGGYTPAGVIYAEPTEAVYLVPMDQVVVVSRDVLLNDGYTVYRVERSGPNRILWARRGDGEIVRVFATPRGRGVAVHGVREVRHEERPGHKAWVRRAPPAAVIAGIDTRLRHGH